MLKAARSNSRAGCCLRGVEGPGSLLPTLQRLPCFEGDESLPPGHLFQNCHCLVSAVTKEVHRGHRPDIHTGMGEKHGERIAPSIPLSTQLLERGSTLPGVFVAGLCIPSPDGFGLRNRVMGEPLDKLFERHCHTPSLMFCIASSPKSR